MSRCLIITGGSIDLAFAGSFLNSNVFDRVIGVDGGLKAISELGLVPTAIVGDFDTLDRETFDRYQKLEDIIWDIHKPEKDETDTELAIQTAISMGSTEITLLGATGGRMDHSLGNLHLLYTCLKEGISAYILDEKNRIYLLDGSRAFKRSDLWGKYISFLPLTWEVRGITLKGFRYPLVNKDITIGASLCISNELAEEEGFMTLSSGILICIESHD